MLKFLACFIIILSGCSRIELGVKWADRIALSKVEDYFELSSVQQEKFRDEFKSALQEVQKQDFPKIADLLNRAAATVEKNDFTLDDLDKYKTELTFIIKNCFSKLEPLTERLVKEQALKNFDLFDQEFEKKYNKDIKTLKDSKKSLKNLMTKYQKWIDLSIEYLNSEQKKSLETQVKENPSPVQLQLESRRIIFEKFKSLRLDPKRSKDFLSTFINNWDSLQTEAYIKARSSYQKNLLSWVYQLLQTLNPEQKKILIQNLKKKSLEFKKLSQI